MKYLACVLLALCAACDSAPADDLPVDAASMGDGRPPDATLDAGPADGGPVADAAWAEPDAMGPDLTEAVFDKAHLIVVSIEIDPADWDVLREQGRDGLDTLGADCLDAPWGSPYDWFVARVTVDGATYEEVGVRKKGFFGSLSSSKPSVKIRFDKFVEGQRHEGLQRITLNNNRQDPSLLRTCLAYSIFEAAGAPTPRCNYARLFVNGQDLGVYSHVESIKKPFLRRHFADDSGHVFEGTLSDFTPAYRGTFEQKTDEEVPYPAPIDRVIAALELDDDALLASLGEVIDLDRFFSFWAAEVITAHWDGYAGNTNNFWLYDDPTSGRIVFMPWGPDATFQRPRLLFEGAWAPWSVMAMGALARRLYLHPEGRELYLTRLEELLESAWDVDQMLGQIDAWAALVTPALRQRQRGPHAEAVRALKAFVADQPGNIGGELRRGGADWEFSLRESLCQVEVGFVRGRVETTWGSWPTQDSFATGTGELVGRYNADELRPEAVGGAAGLSEDGAGLILVPAFFGGEDLLFLAVAFDPARLSPGELSMADADCSLNHFNTRSRNVTRIGQCPVGSLTFEAAERRRGAPLVARFDVEIWGQPED